VSTWLASGCAARYYCAEPVTEETVALTRRGCNRVLQPPTAGNNFPVLFIQDGIKFPDFVDAVKT
jgi:hypothetical protein